MKGELVIARGFGDVLLVRRVWGTADGLVYLSSDIEFRRLEAGQVGLPPIGFPACDVYAYSETVARGKGKPKWNELVNWMATK